MKRFSAATAVMLSLALPARGAIRVAEFSTGVALDTFNGPAPVVSHDGYHFAAVTVGADGMETLYKDGNELGKGSPGTYTSPSASAYERRPLFLASISDNGVLLHSMRYRDPGGRSGYLIALNGAPKGALYDRIFQVVATPRGDNAAYSTLDNGHYAVATLSGRTPASTLLPRLIGANASGLYYEFHWSGRDWNYRNLDALPYRDYLSIAAHPTRASLAGIYVDNRGAMLEVDGKESGGPWLEAAGPFYSAEGRLVVPARVGSAEKGRFDAVTVDGRAHTVPAFTLMKGYDPTAGPDGTPYTVSGDYANAVLAVGGKLRPDIGKPISARGWIAFSPSGRRWAIIANGEKRLQPVVDGRVGEDAAVSPLDDARLVFDSETEFHYLGSSVGAIVLACVTLDGQDPEEGRCGRRAASYGYRSSGLKPMRVLNEPKLAPGSLKVTPQ